MEWSRASIPNPQGDVDGFDLEDETVVKFPPHIGLEITPLVQIGSTVDVIGRRHETHKGHIHLHADKISCGEQFVIVKRHPKKHSHAMHSDLHDEREGANVLHELQAIRKLLEALHRHLIDR